MSLQDLTVQLLNVSLMFSVGLELDLQQVRAASRRRGLLFAMVAFNFGAIPVLAYGLTWGLALPSAVTAGILLSAFAPGGGTGTLLTRVAGGNLALSVVMLALFTLLAVPITPALTLVATPTGSGEALHLTGLLRTLVVFQLLPLLSGVFLRLRSAPWATRANTFARPLSNVVFGVLVVGLLVTQGHLTLELDAMTMTVLIGIVAASMAVPALIPANPSDRAALSLTSGVRNLSLALLLSTTFFTELTTITILTYGLWMYLLSVPIALWVRRRSAKL